MVSNPNGIEITIVIIDNAKRSLVLFPIERVGFCNTLLNSLLTLNYLEQR